MTVRFLHIECSRAPFKVFDSVIVFDVVFVVNFWKPVWILKERSPNEAMNTAVYWRLTFFD